MSWEIWLDDPQGTHIKVLDEVIAFEVAKVANDRAPFTLYLPGTFDDKLLRWDGLIEFWRRPTEGSLRLFNVYFIRHIGFEDDANGRELVVVKGWDLNDLLNRRIVAFAAETAQAKMTDQADDMLKAIVTDALGGDAGTNRNITSLGFSVAADLADGPSITKGFAWKNVLEELQEISKDSNQQGTALFFDMIPSFGSDGLLDIQFQTFTGQIGQDRTADSDNPVYVGKAWGNLTEPFYYVDRREEINFSYAGGQGIQSRRDVQDASNDDQIGESIWNRCEGFVSAVDQSDSNSVVARAREQVDGNRPIRRFGGRIVDAGDFRYDIDYRFGDQLTAEYRRIQFDSMINVVVFRVDETGQEDMDCRLEVEE